MGMFEPARIFAVKKFFADFFTEKIANIVAKNRSDENQRHKNPDIEKPSTCKYSSSEKQAVARKKETKKKPRLRKNNSKNTKVSSSGNKSNYVKHARYYT